MSVTLVIGKHLPTYSEHRLSMSSATYLPIPAGERMTTDPLLGREPRTRLAAGRGWRGATKLPLLASSFVHKTPACNGLVWKIQKRLFHLDGGHPNRLGGRAAGAVAPGAFYRSSILCGGSSTDWCLFPPDGSWCSATSRLSESASEEACTSILGITARAERGHSGGRSLASGCEPHLFYYRR